MAWTIVLLIIGVIIFYFLKDRNKMLENNVDQHGGMKQKYTHLIDYFINNFGLDGQL